MKNLKKVVAIMLAVLMLTSTVVMLNSCNGATEENPGAIIDVYMPYSVSFDPAVAYADDASAKLLSLLYEGLTTINSKGKVEGAIADEWKTYTDRDGNKVLEIKLKSTRWNDGITVDAEDFLESWERILDPAFNCQAASLLFPIKNAVDVKRGDKTLSDLGILASSQDTLTILLEDWADPDTFLRNCASVALYPIRQDVISKLYDRETGKENDWSTLIAIMQSNGPFYLKSVSFGTVQEGASGRPYMVLERNKEYYRDPEKNQSLDKYVVPYRININMTYGSDDVDAFVTQKYNNLPNKTTLLESTKEEIKAQMTEAEIASYGEDFNKVLEEKALTMIKADLAEQYSVQYAASILQSIQENKAEFYGAFQEGSVLYNNSLPSTEESISGMKTMNSMMTGSFLFNTENEIFAKKEVRQALSLALDREAIASLVKYAKAADTLVTSGVFNTTRKTSFKDNAKDYAISTTANTDQARTLLKSAGVTSGHFDISVRATETDILIAQYAAEVWGKLGFDVGIKVYGYNLISYMEGDQIIYDNLLHDSYVDAYNECDFDVMFYDVNMLTTDAFPVLAQFASVYSGRAYDFSTSAEFDVVKPHITGYKSSEYDSIMQQALVETNAAKRADLLHSAEELLLNDLPVVPVIFYQNTYIVSSELDDYEKTYFGATDFKEATYDNYVPAVEEDDAE